MRRNITAAIAAGLWVAIQPGSAAAQHEHGPGMAVAPVGPLQIPLTRMGSGTSWLPDAAPMYAFHGRGGSWAFMLHGVVFVGYDRQAGPRGDEQFNSLNWVMGMASRPAARGMLTLRAMFSTEPFTVGARGYPLLLQSGEVYQGEPLHDRQHPHDLFMELAALYEHPLTKTLAFSIYLAPVGEPALGPVAFPHRPSASNDPLAPLAHHWQDATHTSFGVVTGGLFTRRLKVEASFFNGREPDENRYNFDYRGRSLDSRAARVTVNPAGSWSLSASYGFLKSPEELQPDESERRLSASLLYSSPEGTKRHWSWTLSHGAKKHSGGGEWQHSVLAETNLDLDGHNAVFARAGYVRKTAVDLAMTGPAGAEFDITHLSIGYLRELGSLAGLTVGLGGVANLARIPAELRDAYGTRTPRGFAVYVRIRPKAMEMQPPERR